MGSTLIGYPKLDARGIEISSKLFNPMQRGHIYWMTPSLLQPLDTTGGEGNEQR
jgi:hypothetical protein